MLVGIHQYVVLQVGDHGDPDYPLHCLHDVGGQGDWAEIGRVSPAASFVERDDMRQLEAVRNVSSVQGSPQNVCDHYGKC